MKKRIKRRFRNRRILRRARFFVYIVECKDGTYYTGFSNNLENRIILHNNGKGAKYTRDRRPVKLVWKKEYRYFKRAFLEEKRIKTLTRIEKEELVKSFKNRKSRKRRLKEGLRRQVKE